MKKIIITLTITLLACVAFSQNYATIYVVGNKFVAKQGPRIYLNESFIGSISNKQNYQIKLLSTGPMTLALLYSHYRANIPIEVELGKEYYVYVNYSNAFSLKNEIIDNAEGKKLFDANEKTFSYTESIDNPVGNISERNSGPKQGTAFQVSQNGHFLTNYHVIEGANTVQLTGLFGDYSTSYGVEVLCVDVDLDLALLKIKNPNLSFQNIPYGFNQNITKKGEKAFVLGYPLTSSMGQEIKITDGLISSESGYKGSVSQYQFSASIQPGNSGSPLFDSKGNVIGLTNAKLIGAESAGYAIKSIYLTTFLKDLCEISLEPKTDQGIANLGLSDKVEKLKNFIVIVKAE